MSVRAAARIIGRPAHWPVLIGDLLGIRQPLRPDREHLAAAMHWLCRAQDACDGGGVSAGYYLTDGWLPPYPETTGYIIETFLRYAQFGGDASFHSRALRMGDWECEIQLPEGGVRGQIGINEHPIVFNTGQVIIGWLALYEATGHQRYLEAASRAGDWLAAVQEPEGTWAACCHGRLPHAYHSRVAWPLLWLYRHTRRPAHYGAAERCITWVVSQAQPNAWVRWMGFTAEPWAYTHTIAYTMRGLLESSLLLHDEVAAAARRLALAMAEKTMMLFELAKDDPRAQPRNLPGAFDERWRPVGRYSCLTGCAQLALNWMRVCEITDDPRYLNAALKLLDQVKHRQRLTGPACMRGAIAGSYPHWGGYERFGYPNWAAKFFADALMLQETLMDRWEKETGR